jgi:thymidylate synthase (FAD)
MTDLFVQPSITAIGITQALPGFNEVQKDTGWLKDYRDSDAESIIEFAGRGCYESWSRPNPATATNAGYLEHIMEVGHFSVIEHGAMTFYCRGLSRSLTHELVRHRHFSYSQLSQRYVDPGAGQSNTGPVQPPISVNDELAEHILAEAWSDASMHYENLVRHFKKKNPDATRKEWRQAARSVLPNMTETRLVLTGNFRALRHYFAMRCTESADAEIRHMACLMLDECKRHAPNIFADFKFDLLPDGSRVASSKYSEA